MGEDLYNRAYMQKPITELTEEDLEEMAKDKEALQQEEAQLAKRITQTEEDLEDLSMGRAMLDLFKEAFTTTEGLNGVRAALDALGDYATEHGGITIHEFLHDPNLPEILKEIQENALAKFSATKETQNLPDITRPGRPIRPDKAPLLLGKIETRIWNLLAQETSGQIVFDLAGPARKHTQPKAPAYYSINFDEMDEDESLKGVVRQLTPTDKRIYTAIAALYEAGNTSMSYTQIYYATGRTGKPGWRDRETIEKSVLKMMRAFITINDEKAAAALGRESYPIKTHLLPAAIAPLTEECRKLKGEERGRVAPLIEPPLITYAKRHKQITTLPLKLLQGPISKTDAGIALEDYLLETIAHAKRAHKSAEVRTYDTIAERIRQTDKKQRQRLQEKVLRELEYFKECNHIKGYNERPDGVEILL